MTPTDQLAAEIERIIAQASLVEDVGHRHRFVQTLNTARKILTDPREPNAKGRMTAAEREARFGRKMREQRTIA